jgi:6-phosphogluconate dehydrogenase (decarboxylating)
MKLAMVGLGRLGGNMVRLLQDEHEIVAWDRSAAALEMTCLSVPPPHPSATTPPL